MSFRYWTPQSFMRMTEQTALPCEFLPLSEPQVMLPNSSPLFVKAAHALRGF